LYFLPHKFIAKSTDIHIEDKKGKERTECQTTAGMYHSKHHYRKTYKSFSKSEGTVIN